MTTAANNIATDNAFAAEIIAAIPAVVAHHRAELDVLRVEFLAGLAAIESVAAVRKTVGVEALDAALTAAAAVPEVGWRAGRSASRFVDRNYNATEPRGAYTAAGMAFGGTYKVIVPTGRGYDRHDYVWMSAADETINTMCLALRDEVCTAAEREAFAKAQKAVDDYHRHLRNVASREANATKRAAVAVAAGSFAVGEVVEVHAFGHWYRGQVTKLGRTGKVTVRYTSGTGTTREKAVDATKIRKAA